MKPGNNGQGLVISLIGLLFLSPTAFAQTTHVVTVGDNFFSPSSLTIDAGDTVEWRNAAGGMPHDVTANDGSFASQTASSFTFSVTFNDPGSWSYLCTVHPSAMTGVITVQAVAAAAELVLEEVSVTPGNYAQGSAISIAAEVRNTGNAASGAFTIRHYASVDSSITAQDALLGTENRSGLPAGENSDGPFNAAIPSDLPPGSYFIGSIVQFSDGNSGNNTNVAEDTINVTAVSNFQLNAGLSDAWYDPATDGQGFFIIVWEGIQTVFLSWFTYDTERPPQDVTAILGEPGHRWLTAQGGYSGDTATLSVFLTSGGVFDAAQPPAVTDPTPIGTITIVWTSCTAGTLSYDLPGLGLSGDIPIQRIVLANVPLCQALLGQ
jgi:plastocyanin